MQRSQKFQSMSDEEILELYAQGPKGEKKWYLDQEIEIRNLSEKAKQKRNEEVKSSKTPLTIGKILFFVILVSIFLSRFLKRF